MLPFSDSAFHWEFDKVEKVEIADPESFRKVEQYLIDLHKQVIKPGKICYPSLPCDFGTKYEEMSRASRVSSHPQT